MNIDMKATVSDVNQRAMKRLKLVKGLMNAEQMIQIQVIAKTIGMLMDI
ncbi:hypothetical protein [Leptothermofonsia sp. ETS-13]